MEHTQPLTDNLVGTIQKVINAPDRADEQLLEVCFAVLTLEESDALQNVPAEERKRWAKYIRSYQHPANGLFNGPGQVETSEMAALEKITLRALRSTHFALHALSVLSSTVSHRLQFTDVLTNQSGYTRWVDGLDWVDIVPTSESIMYLLSILIYRVELEVDRPSATLYHSILDWLEHLQDRKSGLWGLNSGASLEGAVVAGCHFFPYYGYVNRPVMRISRIADCCLQLLQSHYSWLSGASSEKFYFGLAAESLLSVINRISSYRQKEITQDLIRSRQAFRFPPSDSNGFFSEEQEHSTLNKREQPTVIDELNMHPLLLACLNRIAVSKASSADVKIETQQAAERAHRWPILGCCWGRDSSSPAEQGLLQIWERPYRVPVHMQSSPVRNQSIVSVIMPCYNLGIFLHDAIQSILDQTFRNFEIVIVDDGSTEQYTRWVLSQLDLPRTRIIRQENRGLAAARNAGTQQALGDYICCLDPDDMLRPGFYAAATQILDTQPEIGIVTGCFRFFDEREGDYSIGEFTFADLLANNQIISPALFRKSAWEQVGGYCETFSSAGIEDWDFWISIYEAGYRAHLLPEVLYNYRIRMDSMSASMYAPESWRCMIAELIQRHRAAYAKNLEAVLEKLNHRWADDRKWTLNLERGLTWWERQSGIWQHEAESSGRMIQILEAGIRSLEEQIERADLRPSTIDGLREKAAGQPSGLEEGRPETEMPHSLNRELQERIDELEAERIQLEKMLAEQRDMTSSQEWIVSERGDPGREVWYRIGKLLGFIQSNLVHEEEPDDRS